QFKEGVAPSEIVATRSGNALILSIVGTTDRVQISDFFYGQNPRSAYNPIQQARFADGTVWDVQALTNKYFEGSAADDALVGTVADDMIYGQGGNDTLYGGLGNDTLDGGAGNDTLYGESGNDTYLFGKGDGQDTIASDYDTSAGKLNVLQFKEGVAPSEIVATRSGNALILSIVGTTDRVQISDFFYGQNPRSAYNPIQQARFADGTVWDVQALTNKYFEGSAADDALVGTVADDMIYGQGGNDTLYGGLGNDTLDGGAGNDTLYGESGNDTYYFSRGFGVDTVYDYDTTTGNKDVAQFAADIASDQLWFRRNGINLEVSVIGSTDKMTISSWYSGTSYQIEQFRAGDGKNLSNTQVQVLVEAMASFSPPAAGQSVLSPDYKNSLDAVISASWK
ncbi:calcium-binding protein, partial [Comamonas guangdongensis]